MQKTTRTNLIVTYNSLPDVLGLLADLRLNAADSPTIVVDNASADGTAAAVRAAFPEVRLVPNSANLGYARAVNQGFTLCASDYVFLLNPDVRIPSPQVLPDLHRCLDAFPKAAAVGPLQFKPDAGRDRLNYTWSYWSPHAIGLYLSHLLGRPRALGAPIPVRFLNAGCLLLRRSAFDQVGGLNERYFLYGEEPDLFLKFWRYGFACFLLPYASVHHSREQSLKSVPGASRWLVRLRGGLNIVDAIFRGAATILLDRLLGRVPA